MAKSPSEQRPTGSNRAGRAASRAKAPSTPEEDDAPAPADNDPQDAAGLDERETRPARPEERLQPPALALKPRFRIFIIDSGWNSVAGKVLRDNLALFNDLTPDHPTYLVDRETSVRLLRRHQDLVGCDPIIHVHDLKALEQRRRGAVYGVRAHLGMLRDERSVISLLQLLAGFLSRYRDSDKFEQGVRSSLRLEGLEGAIEIVMGATAHKELIE